MTAENTPDAATGRITHIAVCQGVAPAASEAALRWVGTAFSASSARV
jgi:hypothetical protein